MTTRNDMHDRNRRNIEEFRANGGRVGGNFEGAPLLLLTTTGAKSGQQRVTPLMYLPDGERWIVFASKGGAPSHPDWFRNLSANPTATVEVGSEHFEATVEILAGEERDRIYARQSELYPQFAAYQEKTSRVIPAIALVRSA